MVVGSELGGGVWGSGEIGVDVKGNMGVSGRGSEGVEVREGG